MIGETKDGRKTIQRTNALLPETVIYDVDLALSLPPAVSVTSGMNAAAHAVEALYTWDRNPVTSLMAAEFLRSLGQALPAVAECPGDTEARGQALYGAWLVESCLAAVGVALHHNLCHVLGGTFDLPHAQTHTVVLPHAGASNAAAPPEAMGRIASALGVDDAARGLYELAGRLGTRVAWGNSARPPLASMRPQTRQYRTLIGIPGHVSVQRCVRCPVRASADDTPVPC